ncbi:MFS transporter [Rhodococcus sp. IEGM 1370]|uniref:MFS transporter n=1 Tax=Rhodococcus sp. IEGM 1370 TaxID=3082222 RepID=UPI002952998B|nr:MFS transporter [Rhodococcus sp. IEGM 1370]MDV8079561.1 MFS transporter [Rhodococcus sp. IEGM 1370]
MKPTSETTPSHARQSASSSQLLDWKRAGLYMAFTFSVLQLLGEVGALMAIPLYASMSADLNLTPSQVSWTLLSTLLMGAISTALLAKTGDVFGHRRVILSCAGVIVAGYAVSALATSFSFLLIGRALTGVVAAQALFIAIMNDRLSPIDRNRAVGVIAGGQAVGITIGFGLGGALIALGASWRMTFWVGGLLTLAGLFAMYRWGSDSDTASQRLGHKKNLNIVGLLVIGISLTSVCLGVSQSTTWGLTSTPTLVFTIAGIIGITLGLYWESRNPHPLVDTSLVLSSKVLPAYGVFVALGVVGILVLNFVMGWAQTPAAGGYGFGLSPLMAGLLFAPMTVSGIIAGRFMPRALGHASPKYLLFGSGLLLCLSCISLYFFHTSILGTAVSIFLYGLAFSALLTVAVSVIASQAPRESAAGTASLYVSISLASGAVGTAVYAAIIGFGTSATDPLPQASNFSMGFLAAAVVALIPLVAGATLSKQVSLARSSARAH